MENKTPKFQYLIGAAKRVLDIEIDVLRRASIDDSIPFHTKTPVSQFFGSRQSNFYRACRALRRQLAVVLIGALGFVPLASANPSEDGQWSGVINWPHIPVSAASLPDGKILTWSARELRRFPHNNNDKHTHYTIWDPESGGFDSSIHNTHDMFCAHVSMLEDGRMMANGGNGGGQSPEVSLFDYQGNNWNRVENMQRGRWYPTSLAMPDGGVFTMIGSGGDKYPEVWRENQGWELKGGINFDGPILNYSSHYERNWWPLIHLAPNGKIFHSG
ncbi:MAG: hypothetical protein AAF420_11230, partial [Pseudomonadota bacterium]